MVKVTSFTDIKARGNNNKSAKSSKSSYSSKKRPHNNVSKPSVSRSENPFDKFANSRKKHEVLNRRVKGEDRDVGRAKAKAVDDRRKRLVDQHNKVKKSNLFLDKRFGEADADLSLEDKMFLRFQKEKIRSTKNLSMYNLDSIPEESLTHHGQVLGVSNINEANYSDDEDEDDKLLSKDIVNRLHFGGGLVEKANANGTTSSSHYDALQDIITKSKQQKLMKKEAKDELDIERERLDAAFRELVSESAVEYRPIRGENSGQDDEGDAGMEVDDYDKTLNMMAYEAKVRATDRTKTAEELAIEAKEKLEELETARIARMKKPVTVNDDEGDGDAAAIVKSKRIRTDDEIDFDDVYGKRKKGHDSRNMASTAAGDDDDELEGEDDEENEEEDDDDVDVDEEDSSEDESDIDYDEERGDDEDDDEEDEEVDEEDDDDEVDDDVADVIEDDLVEDKHKLRNKLQSSSNKTSHDESSTGRNMPHKIVCPATIQEFYDLMEQYTKSLADINILIDRILIWNSAMLPGAEGVNNKATMHNFLDILFKYFVRVGDTLANADDTREVMIHLDFLSQKIFRLCTEIKDVVPALCGRWMKMMEAQLQKRLRDYSIGTSSSSSSGSCFPSLGRILLFKLYGHIFSVSDYHHAIVSAMIIFLAQTLAQCPIDSTQDVSSGLLIISILYDLLDTVKGKSTSSVDNKANNDDQHQYMYIPEITSFLVSLLSFYQLHHSNTESSSSTFVPNKNFNATRLSSLRQVFYTGSNISIPAKISWQCFKDDVSIDATISSSILVTIYHQLSHLLQLYEPLMVVPELFADAAIVMQSIHPHQQPCMSTSIQQTHLTLLSMIISLSASQQSSRSPLQWRKIQTVAIENKTPRFDVNYKMKKDSNMDDDAEKTLLKQLKRQLKREKKAATRELRRDGEFLDQLKYNEKLEQRREQQEERWKNYAWMEQQQAVLNTHVKKFRGEVKGGGSNGVKPVKHKRANRGGKK